MKFIKSKKGFALLVSRRRDRHLRRSARTRTSPRPVLVPARPRSAPAFVLHATTAGLAYPGNGPTGQTVTFTVDNNGNASQNLAAVTLTSVQACSIAWTYPGGTPTCTGTTIATCGEEIHVFDVSTKQDVDGRAQASGTTPSFRRLCPAMTRLGSKTGRS